MKRTLPLPIVTLLLVACSACVAPGMTPVAITSAGTTATPIATTAAPTVTVQPTSVVTPVLTITPTATEGVQPTSRPTSSPTATPTATPTIQPTSTRTATPTIQPTSTPTDQPTVQPQSTTLPPRTGVKLAAARAHQIVGDCSSARRELADLLAGKPSAAEASEARFRMAQCYLRDDAPDEALATLSELLTAAAQPDPYRAPATFLLGETLAGLGRWRDAEAAYLTYLPAAPEVAYLTWQRIGAARRALDDLPGAVAAYQSALKTSPDWTNTVAIRRALADLALQQNSPREAVAQYDILRGKETTGKWAAEMQYLAGTALAKGALAAILPGLTPPAQSTPGASPAVTPAGTPPSDLVPAVIDAQTRWRAAVEADITSPYAHSAIVALLDSGAVVDEYQRGLANYHKGNYELAIAAFDRLLAAEPGGRDGAARYYTGLSYLALDQTDRGNAELDAFIDKHPASPLWADAWMAKGRALAKVDRDAEAIAAYRRLAELRPDAPQAPKALWQAALLTGQPGPQPSAAAAEAYLVLARRYPKADEGWRAYQNAGLTYFKLGDWRRAAEIWSEMAENATLPAFTRPVAYFWLGRAQAAAGDRAAALRSWQTAAASGPESFYGLRADAWARGKEDQWEDSAAPQAAQPDADATEIAAWLRTWAGAGSLELAAEIKADPDWQRGETLLALGLRAQALANWGRVQKRYEKNPWAQTALALAFRDAGAHRLSLLSAEQVANLSGKTMSAAPLGLQRLVYPFPFAELIRAEAAKHDLDPRLLAAIIRQESRFETGAASSVGAQGLMQVMPGTAESIAGQLEWPNFEPQQAYWPYVNVAFGAYYVQQWLRNFDGSVFTALAAYNGGPGNASAWHKWAPQDDDLLAALININETRTYVQAVWLNYEAYARLYPR
jgi:soluble lytic murein transglycosylase